jgi:hypothetical protein
MLVSMSFPMPNLSSDESEAREADEANFVLGVTVNTLV